MSKLFPLQIPRIMTTPAAQVASWFANALTRRVVACLLLFGVSAGLILPNLGYPRAIVFDETYYITHAQKYLNGVFFLQTHPPLGKLLIAAGERWLHPDAPAIEFVGVEKIEKSWPQDVDITGYRLMPALFGILNPILVFMILALILQRELYTLAISLFIAFDNALIVQSRAALLDSFLIFFSLGSFLLFVMIARQENWETHAFIALAAVWGIVQACAANVKLSGVVVLVFVAVYALQLVLARKFRRVLLLSLVFGVMFATTYLGLWQIHFAIATKINPANTYGISQAHRNILTGADNPDPFNRFLIQFKEGMAYQINSGFNIGKLDLSNPKEVGSAWYSWFVGGRAIDYRWETPDGAHFRYIYLLGNPITWAVSLLGVIAGTAVIIADALFHFLRKRQRQWLYVPVLLYWANMVPFILASRVTYPVPLFIADDFGRADIRHRVVDGSLTGAKWQTRPARGGDDPLGAHVLGGTSP